MALLPHVYSNAQEVSVTTGNLITNTPGSSGQESTWTGAGGYSQLGGQQPSALWGCCTSYSGAAPFLDTSTGSPNGQSGQIHWSYGQATVRQIIGINTALSQAGVGLQINGYNWGYEVRNMNGGANGAQGPVDTLTATTFLKDGSGTVVLNNTRVYNTLQEWNWHGGTVTAPSPLSWSQMQNGQLGIEFTSRDTGFWAGYYGPQVRNVSLSLNYSVDPCSLNPLFSSSCAGFNDIVTSSNLVNSSATASWGQGLNQTFNIATALEHSGSGVMVHGFQWGLDASVPSPYCAFWLLWCHDNRDPDLTAAVNIRNSNGTSLYSWSAKGVFDDRPGWQTYNFSHVLPQSRNSLSLGNFEFTAQTSDSAAVSNMYARILYTADPCTKDPLYSASCPGYYQALQALVPAASPTTTVEIVPVSVAVAETTAAGSVDPISSIQTAATSSSSAGNDPQSSNGANTGSATTGTSSGSTSNSATAQTATVAAAGEPSNPSQKKDGPSLSQIQSIVGSELNRIGQLESKTVSESLAQAEAAAQSATAQAEAVAGSLTEQSIQGSIEQAQSAMAQAQSQSQQSNSNAIQAGTASAAGAASSAGAGPAAQSSSAAESQQLAITLEPPTPPSQQTIGESQNHSQDTAQSLPKIIGQTPQPTEAIQPIDTGVDNLILPPQTQTAQPVIEISTGSELSVISSTVGLPAAAVVETPKAPVEENKTEEILNPLYSLLPPLPRPVFVTEPEPEPARTEAAILSNTPRPEQAADRPVIVENKIEPAAGPAVNKSVANNEAAGGGLDLTAIAVQPQGFAAYTTSLTDAAFYAPKEIYKNQKTVDNQRAVRFLNAASDKLHQQMVDQQYQGAK